jgi:hypothetical protein
VYCSYLYSSFFCFVLIARFSVFFEKINFYGSTDWFIKNMGRVPLEMEGLKNRPSVTDFYIHVRFQLSTFCNKFFYVNLSMTD